MEPSHEKKNVKPAYHKIYQGRYYFLPSLSKYLFSDAILSIKRFQCLLAQRSVSSARGSFVLFNFAPNPCVWLDGWKMLKLHRLQQILLVLFEIYIRKLIIRIESWFWLLNEGMNGTADMHIVWLAIIHRQAIHCQCIESSSKFFTYPSLVCYYLNSGFEHFVLVISQHMYLRKNFWFNRSPIQF